MSSGTLRLGLAAAALIALWVLVYWWTPAPDDGLDLTFAPPEDGPALVLEELPEPPPAQSVGPAPTGAQGSAETSKRPAAPAVVPPSFRRYTVRAGDTAQRISRRFYGTTAHWQAVMKANPKTDFQKLREGAVILVPVNPNNVQGTPTAGAGAPKLPPGPEPTRASRDTEERARQVTNPDGFTYIVESGDTLSGLAQRFYGRASSWPAIVAVNRELLGERGEKLRPGMTITIPPAPEPAQQKDRRGQG